MDVHHTPLPGVLLIVPRVFEDPRGFFLETWQRRRFSDEGIDIDFVQDNWSHSARGTLRGLHYQLQHPQSKLVQVVRGTVFDVAVDLRRDSPAFGQSYCMELSAENHRQLLIPAGLRLETLSLSERGSWDLILDDDVKVTVGRVEVIDRIKRFIEFYDGEIRTDPAHIEAVDLRYSNGISVRRKADDLNGVAIR